MRDFKVAAAFGIGLLMASGATLAQSYGRGRNVQFVDGATISPTSVQASGTGDQFMCTSTTAVCEVESNISAATMTSTVPAFDIGPTATPGANDRLACFSYGPSGSKTRMMCVDDTGDLNATSLRAGVAKYPNQIRLHALTQTTNYGPAIFTGSHAVFGRDGDSGANSGGVWLSYHTTDNEGIIGALSPGTSWRPLSLAATSVKIRPAGGAATVTLGAGVTSTGAIEGSTLNATVASGNQAFTCTNVGCRLSLGNTGRYFYDDGSSLASIGGITAGGQFKTSSQYETTFGFFTATGVTASVVSNVGSTTTSVNLRSTVTKTGDTTKLVDITNNTTNVAHFSKDGLLRVNSANAAKPTCNADNRGRVFFLDGASLVADTFEVCGKDAANAYAWKAIVTF